MTATRKYATTTEEQIRLHLAQGLTIAETAAALGVSPRMLHHCCSVLGLRSHGRGASVTSRDVIRHRPRRPVTLKANDPFGVTA